jgi:hypothetical protein
MKQEKTALLTEHQKEMQKKSIKHPDANSEE